MSTTQSSRLINASPEALYRAFTNPAALEAWLAPGEMKGKVHAFDLGVGSSYTMSLFYPSNDRTAKGKTAAHEDRFTSRFITLQPYKRIVEAVRFDSSGPGFVGEMIMEVRFEPEGRATRVTMIFSNIPLGIKPEDNEKGTEQSLEKLENYVREAGG
ncbi:MAG TPA: SRPBCC domain-containing protein [Puia sp.]|jgi:uncharacterized protein YndB with AHSA1/START domain|nr:SRPBCC domain-containing protein [Puia sp.]